MCHVRCPARNNIQPKCKPVQPHMYSEVTTHNKLQTPQPVTFIKRHQSLSQCTAKPLLKKKKKKGKLIKAFKATGKDAYVRKCTIYQPLLYGPDMNSVLVYWLSKQTTDQAVVHFLCRFEESMISRYPSQRSNIGFFIQLH